MSIITAGYYQFRPLFAKSATNTNKIIHALDGVAADLIVLPELCLSGYYFKDKQEAIKSAEDPKNSKNLDRIAELCQRNSMYIVIGFAERCGDRCFNSAALISPNGIEHIYRKIHLFHEEKFCFDQSNTPLTVHTIKGVVIGIMICFDWVFPEVTRTLALKGAELICHPCNLVLNFCQQTMLARTIENNVFAITANRYGIDKRPQGSLKFTGKSQVVAPKGQLIHKAPSQRDALFITQLECSQASDKMITQHNHLFTDRRPDFYHL